MIRCKNINKSYGKQVVLKDFSYEFQDKGFYLLFGESGSGKTTLLNLLCGFLEFDSGTICVNGQEYETQIDRTYMEKRMDYIVQDSFFVEFLTVMDNLKMIKNDEKKIQELLKKFGLDGKENLYPSVLSGGEKQRLALVRSFMSKRDMLFLDEPTASLDVKNKHEIFQMLEKISQETLVICSSHDEEAIQYAEKNGAVLFFEKMV